MSPNAPTLCEQATQLYYHTLPKQIAAIDKDIALMRERKAELARKKEEEDERRQTDRLRLHLATIAKHKAADTSLSNRRGR